MGSPFFVLTFKIVVKNFSERAKFFHVRFFEGDLLLTLFPSKGYCNDFNVNDIDSVSGFWVNLLFIMI